MYTVHIPLNHLYAKLEKQLSYRRETARRSVSLRNFPKLIRRFITIVYEDIQVCDSDGHSVVNDVGRSVS